MRGSQKNEPGRDSDEKLGTIRLSAGIFLGVTEVSQREWDSLYGAGAAARVITESPTKSRAIGANLPMHSVRWDEAVDFCAKLSARDGKRYRLPTEAEWEYACRAGTGTAFNTGTDFLSSREANIDDETSEALVAPAAVGTVGRANAWGLLDMHGNVWEWCADWSAPYPAEAQTDPRGPSDSEMGRSDLAMRVVRGGGWNAPAREARSANRWEYAPSAMTGYLGFRIVLEPDFSAP